MLLVDNKNDTLIYKYKTAKEKAGSQLTVVQII
jgi:hypothetical protein